MAAPALVDLRIIQGETWIKPFRVLTGGALLDTSAYTARMKIRPDIDGSNQLTLTTENGLLGVGFDPPKRTDSAAYGLGQQIVPVALNGYIYECTVAGTSGSSAPAYSTTLNATFSDGTVTWTVKKADTAASNVRITLAPTDTTPLTDWGLGIWDLELVDAYGHVKRIFEGSCVLSREVTR